MGHYNALCSFLSPFANFLPPLIETRSDLGILRHFKVCLYFFVMNENKFQAALKKEIRSRFPGSYILKTDPSDIQGIPDLLILHNDKWAALEVKKSQKASHRPNQDYRVEEMNNMSYAAFIFPENKEAVLNELAQLFETDSGR